MNIDCEESSRWLVIDPPSSRGFFEIVNLLQVNLTCETLSEPMSTHISKTMNQMQARIKLLEHQYRKTDQFIISNEPELLEAK